jgi:two-component system sensor histidine kinase KdpD
MSDGRRDPDELLRHAQEEERRARRGKLVVFFGAAPGVGKTYAMLEAARTERDLKRDVVLGVVETHGRYDTGALVIGLEMLPRRKVDYRGVVLEELDLDGALARKPGLLLVDELAHTNAPGSRHARRWQDVEELLDAGIDVYTTLNVQHLESLSDVVAQVTGVVVRETVPDRVLEDASEIRLIDLPPDELIERLAEGKVYVPDQAQRAIGSFFRKGNLIALRELALRETAERVDAQMRVYRTEHGIQRVWPAGERILVGVSPSPTSARLVRAARRMAGSLHAQWVAVYVETPASLRLSDADRARVAESLRLAEQLGAETVTLSGESAAQETIRYARAHNVTKIVVGKPTHPRWRDILRPSFLDEVVRSSGDIAVYVISGNEDEGQRAPARADAEPSPVRAAPYAASAVAVAMASAIAWFAFGRGQLADVVMVYLLGIIVVAMRFGYGPSVAAAVLSVLASDYLFVEPYYSFQVTDFEHVVTFSVMFVVAVVVSGLTQRIRAQASAARGREQRTASLYGLARELAAGRAVASLATVAVSHVAAIFEARVAILVGAGQGEPLLSVATGPAAFTPAEQDHAVIEWVRRHDKPAGVGTDTLPSAGALYVPLRPDVGVLGVQPTDARRLVDPDQRALLDVFAAQIATALERARLGEEAAHAQVQMEAERLRSSLLSSVSHDLRTPLAVITGAASALLDPEGPKEATTRRDLAVTISEEAQRLNRLVRNLLDMTKITSGAIRVKKDWQPLEEVVGSALTRMEDQLEGWNVSVRLPPDLPLVPIDAVLVEQLLINLLENATKYTHKGTSIDIEAHTDAERDSVTVDVVDHGPGIPADLLDKIFEKFYRLPREHEGGGAGLGLAICRGIIEAHGGRIWAENRAGGGAVFHFVIPVEGTPPVVAMEEAG